MNNCQFKFKPDKIKYLSNIDTLDSTHKKTMENINKKRDDVPKKTKRLEKIKYDLEELDKNNPGNINYISQRTKLLEEMGVLEEDIGCVENYEEEMDYYSKTYDILFNYYDIIDAINPNEIKEIKDTININNINKPNTITTSSNGIIVDNSPNNNLFDTLFDNTNSNNNTNNNNNKINEIDNTETNNSEYDTDILTNTSHNQPNTNNSNNFNNFNIDGVEIFNSKSSKLDLLNQLSKMKRKEKKTTRKRVKNVESLIKDNNNIFDYIEANKTNSNSNTPDIKAIKYDRATLYEDYKFMLEGYVSKKKNTKPCIDCGIDKILIHNEGIYACMKCGEVENCIVESEITNYKDPMIEKPTFPYKRKNHFCEWNKTLNCSLEWVLKRLANVNYILLTY